MAIRKFPSSTKSGPGRVHVSGHKKASPIKRRGAGTGFVQHTASAEKAARRALVKAKGRRGAIKAAKAARRVAREVLAAA